MTAPTIAQTQRAYATFTPKWQRFQSTLIISSTQVSSSKKGEKQQLFPYQRQYSHVYHQRLAVLGPRCWERIDEEQKQHEMNDADENKVVKVQRILELREDVPSLVVGALVKESSANGGSSSSSGDAPLHPDSHCKASDALYLEDESGRVSLGFSPKLQVSLHEFPTGVVLGLQGTVGMDGVMAVDAIYTPKPPPPPPLAKSSAPSSPPPHLLLLSGLHCGAPDVSSLPRDMLLSFLQGHFGTEKAACVSHVVIAGGLIYHQRDGCNSNNDVKQQQRWSKNETTAALRDLDAFLLQMTASGIPVTILPGQDDPTTANWPQRPLHAALLPRSSAAVSKSLLSRAPNPYAAAHHEKLVVGTNGTNVRDLTQRMMLVQPSKSSTTDPTSTTTSTTTLQPISELQALQRTLEWSHICPTGPDSVPTVPHLERDPMVLTQWPSLYFAGNAHKFATRTVQQQQEDHDSDDNNVCRLVCIPEFATTGQAVLVNMETLNVEILRFED